MHFSKEDIQTAKQVHEKMLNTGNHQGNANQNHNEVSPVRMPIRHIKTRNNRLLARM